MKKTYLLFILGATLASCSSDDSNNNGTNNPSGSPIPQTQGSYWVYDVQSTLLAGRDSLYIAGDTVISNKGYKKLKTKAPLPYGFFSNALNNNGIREENGKTYLSGNASLGFSAELPFDISVSDFIIFDKDASANQQLSTVSGTISEVIEGYTLQFNYTLTSKAKQTLSTFTSGDEQYTNVKPVEITLNLSINVKIPGFPITYPIMVPQNVATSTQFYVEGIGAVKSITDIAYQLTEIPGYELPIPQSGSDHQEEVLANYHIE